MLRSHDSILPLIPEFSEEVEEIRSIHWFMIDSDLHVRQTRNYLDREYDQWKMDMESEAVNRNKDIFKNDFTAQWFQHLLPIVFWISQLNDRIQHCASVGGKFEK